MMEGCDRGVSGVDGHSGALWCPVAGGEGSV